MIELYKGAKMNWHKYTIDEWLEQFGAWCNTCMAKGGNLPDGLHVNQIYWLIQSVEPRRTKSYPRCEISDDEALAVNRLLCHGMAALPAQITLVIQHKVQGRSLRELAINYQKSHNFIRQEIYAGICSLKCLTVIT